MMVNTDRHRTKPIPICWCLAVHTLSVITSREAVFEIKWNNFPFIYTNKE